MDWTDPGKYGGQPLDQTPAPPAGVQQGFQPGRTFPPPSDEQRLLPGGGPVGQRALSSFYLTLPGKLAYLRTVYGKDNVMERGGEILFNDGTGWRQWDEAGFSMGDIADLAPEAAITAATMGAGGPLVMGARAATMSAATQLPSLAQGEEVGVLGRAGRVAAEGGLGWLGTKVGGKVSEFLDTVRPSNLHARGMNALHRKATTPRDTDYYREGAEISDELGVDLTPGALTGSRGLTMMENLSRQSGFSADQAFEVDKKLARQFQTAAHNLLNRLGHPGVDATVAGQKIRDTMTAAFKRTLDNREKIAGHHYTEALKAARHGNYRPVRFNMKYLNAELDKLAKEYENVGTDEAEAILRGIERMRERMTGPVDLATAIKRRSHYGRKAAGGGNIFTDGVSTVESKRVSKRIYGAMNDDFMQEDGMRAVLPEEAWEHWNVGNAQWRRFTQNAEVIERSPLASLVGDDIVGDLYAEGARISTKPVEKLAEKLLTLPKSHLTVAREILEKQDPEVWQIVKSYALRRALDASEHFPVSAGSNRLAMNAPEFVKSLEKIPNLDQIFSVEEMRYLGKLFEGMRRWSDKTGVNFSGTAPATEMLGVLNRILSMSVRGAAEVAGRTAGTRELVKLMDNPRGREALLELTHLSPGSRRAVELSAVLGGVVGFRSATEDEAGDGEDGSEGDDRLQ